MLESSQEQPYNSRPTNGRADTQKSLNLRYSLQYCLDTRDTNEKGQNDDHERNPCFSTKHGLLVESLVSFMTSFGKSMRVDFWKY